jgi:hypothetical protein
MEERRPRSIDAVWAENFLIAVRCQEAAAVRERMLRQFESLTPPCRDEYAKHRLEEILKAMGDAAPAAPVEPKIQEVE